jgi:hypothetical protein
LDYRASHRFQAVAVKNEAYLQYTRERAKKLTQPTAVASFVRKVAPPVESVVSGEYSSVAMQVRSGYTAGAGFLCVYVGACMCVCVCVRVCVCVCVCVCVSRIDIAYSHLHVLNSMGWTRDFAQYSSAVLAAPAAERHVLYFFTFRILVSRNIGVGFH